MRPRGSVQSSQVLMEGSTRSVSKWLQVGTSTHPHPRLITGNHSLKFMQPHTCLLSMQPELKLEIKFPNQVKHQYFLKTTSPTVMEKQ